MLSIILRLLKADRHEIHQIFHLTLIILEWKRMDWEKPRFVSDCRWSIIFSRKCNNILIANQNNLIDRFWYAADCCSAFFAFPFHFIEFLVLSHHFPHPLSFCVLCSNKVSSLDWKTWNFNRKNQWIAFYFQCVKTASENGS